MGQSCVRATVAAVCGDRPDVGGAAIVADLGCIARIAFRLVHVSLGFCRATTGPS